MIADISDELVVEGLDKVNITQFINQLTMPPILFHWACTEPILLTVNHKIPYLIPIIESLLNKLLEAQNFAPLVTVAMPVKQVLNSKKLR